MLDIYLSVNNRETVMQIPVPPESFTISKPQKINQFEVVSQKDLQLLSGVPGLKGITIESFFPIEGHDYSYSRNTTMHGWEYVDMLDDWVEKKLPIRLIITNTPINMACAIKNFSYTIKTDGDLWYTLELEEFNLLGAEGSAEDDDELTEEQYNELLAQIEYLEQMVTIMENPTNYAEAQMPDWATTAVQIAIDTGIVDDVTDLHYNDIRLLTWMFRAGMLKNEVII